jgi:hypothetical protein
MLGLKCVCGNQIIFNGTQWARIMLNAFIWKGSLLKQAVLGPRNKFLPIKCMSVSVPAK